MRSKVPRFLGESFQLRFAKGGIPRKIGEFGCCFTSEGAQWDLRKRSSITRHSANRLPELRRCTLARYRRQECSDVFRDAEHPDVANARTGDIARSSLTAPRTMGMAYSARCRAGFRASSLLAAACWISRRTCQSRITTHRVWSRRSSAEALRPIVIPGLAHALSHRAVRIRTRTRPHHLRVNLALSRARSPVLCTNLLC